MNAWDDLTACLQPDEKVEAIVFGAYGWGSSPREGANWELGYSEPDPPPVPFNVRGKVLTPRQAKPLMQGWSFYGGYGAPECYAVTIWTNQRVGWVTQYDGATGLDWAPRNPMPHMPEMPGG